MKAKKRGLVVVYDPHNLYQFLWYYCSYGQIISWDALCLPNDLKGEYMGAYCEKTGIFSRVYRSETEFAHLSLKKKAIMFLKMFVHASIGKRTEYCKRFMKNYVDIEQYETVVILNDIGIVSGACIALGCEKNVVILEDGDADYLPRSNKYIIKEFKNLKVLQGFFLAKLGYANPAHYYPLSTTVYCEKFCSKPELMRYRNYKEMKRLYDYSNTNMALFDELVERIYPEIKQINFCDCDTVFFTYTFQDFVKNVKPYVIKAQDYIENKSGKFLLKKHPMDKVKYQFQNSKEIQEIPSSIPAEVVMKYLVGKNLIFGGLSSVLRYIDIEKYNIEILYFEGFRKVCLEDNMYLVVYQTVEETKERLKSYGADSIKITFL